MPVAFDLKYYGNFWYAGFVALDACDQDIDGSCSYHLRILVDPAYTIIARIIQVDVEVTLASIRTRMARGL